MSSSKEDLSSSRATRRLRKVVSETRRCRDVHRLLPKELRGIDLTTALQSDPNSPLPPSSHVPVNSSDSAFIAFAQLSAIRLNASCSIISLIDDNRQYILAEAGPRTMLSHSNGEPGGDSLWLGNVIIPRDDGICLQVLLEGDSKGSDDSLMVINDLTQHEVCNHSRVVTSGPRWKFWAAARLVTSDGVVVGDICIFDDKPRPGGLSDIDKTFLKDIASATMAHLASYALREDHRRGERMIRGLTSFLEGSSGLMMPELPHRNSEEDTPDQRSPVSTLKDKVSGDQTPNPTQLSETSTQDYANSSVLTDEAYIKSDSSTRSQSSDDGPDTSNLQESLLPTDAKNMFSRAANIIRQASELDGVLILDACIASIGRRSRAGSFDRPHVSRQNSRRNQHSSSGSLSSSSSDGKSTSTEKASRNTQILGFSFATSSSISGNNMGEHPQLSERDFKRLLKHYPEGKSINFTAAGELATSSDEASIDGITDPDESDTYKAIKTSRRTMTQRRLLQSLVNVAPGAKSLCFVPLWDYERSRWFAGALFWTAQPNRYLSPTWDMVYLKAFGNSIMNELSRLDEIATNKMKTTFVASISHELRSPLHGILGGVEFVQNTELDAFQKAMVHSIELCGRTLLDVINHVLDFAKINQYDSSGRPSGSTHFGNTRQRVGPGIPRGLDNFALIYNLGAVTEEVVEAVFASQSYRVAHKRMDDDFDTTPLEPEPTTSYEFEASQTASNAERKLVMVVLDISKSAEAKFKLPAGAWRRILMNLVGNALKYTESGYVKVTVRTQRINRGRNPANSNILLTVEDSGIGMTQDFLKHRVFTPFSQENSFSTGIGLGLNLVRQIISSLNGTIEIESTIGKGSKMTVGLTVPCIDDSATTPADEKHSQLFQEYKECLKDKKVCILQNIGSGSRYTSNSNSAAIKKFGNAIHDMLIEWYGMKPLITSEWERLDSEVVIILEPSFDYLASIRNKARETLGDKAPVVLFVAIDAIEASALRNDARILSKESVVEVIAQPCGPHKLAKIINHCLDRYYSPKENLLENKHSPIISSPGAVSTASTPATVGTGRSSSQDRPSMTSYFPPSGSSATSPVASQSQSSPQKSFTSSNREGPASVLIVDDNAVNRRLLIALMKKRDLMYREAVNGVEAIQAYKSAKNSLKVILMDLSMPIMDGMTATRKIRAYELSNNLPRVTIIALTGLASASARFEALESGIDQFMTKPINFGSLVKMLPSQEDDKFDES